MDGLIIYVMFNYFLNPAKLLASLRLVTMIHKGYKWELDRAEEHNRDKCLLAPSNSGSEPERNLFFHYQRQDLAP